MNLLETHHFNVFIYFDYTIVVLALVANCFVMSAIVRCSAFSKQTFYRYFLISLVASDLYITFINIATLAYQIANDLNFDSTQLFQSTKPTFFKCGANALRTLRLAGFLVNLLSLCGMSLNHFCGVVYPVKYHHLTHKRVTRLAVIAVWFFSFFLVFLDIPINLILYENASKKFSNISKQVSRSDGRATLAPYSIDLESLLVDDEEDFAKMSSGNVTTLTPGKAAESLAGMFKILAEEEAAHQALNQDPCTFHSQAKMWLEFCVIALSLISAIVLIVCYGIIIKMISKNVDTLGRSARKSIFTTVMLVVAYVTCWMPFMTFEFVMLMLSQRGTRAASGEDEQIAFVSQNFLIQNILNSNLMLYPLIDAFIYSARIPAVKQMIVDKIAKTFPCCPRLVNIRQNSSSTVINNNNYCNITTMEMGNGNTTANAQLLETAPDLILNNNNNMNNNCQDTTTFDGK